MKKLLNGLLSIAFILISAKMVLAIPISPDKYFIELSSHDTKQEKLIIMGRQEMTKPVTLYLQPVGMRKVGEENTREFYKQNPNDPKEVANWITLSKTEVTVHPGETVTIPWTITPKTSEVCGTKLAAIIISSRNYNSSETTDESKISLNKEIASQVHVTLTDAKPVQNCVNTFKYRLLEFKVDNGIKIFNKTLPIFNYDSEIFTTRINNDGDIIGKAPKGFIEIYGLGDKITIPFNKQSLDIYPRTIRKFSDQWVDPNYPKDGNFGQKLLYEITHLRFGKYTAQLGITKNTDTPLITQTTFWIIPWRIITVLLGIILLTYILAKIKHGKNKKSQNDDNQDKK